MGGRRPAYIIGFVIYMGACVGIALQNKYAALFVLRCLQSAGSSSTIALASGVVSDVVTAAERGSWMGYVTAGSLLGPSVGPIIGGALSQFLGWRSIFWFLVILAGSYLLPFLIFFPETGRKIVGNGSIAPRGLWNMSLMNYLRVRKARLNASQSQSSLEQAPCDHGKRRLRFPNPLGSIYIIFDKETAMLLFYNSLIFCGG